MRISDWSSDVCSSDLLQERHHKVTAMPTSVLDLYRRITRWPAGQWLFSRAVCFKAPYFANIRPRIELLEPGRCVASLRHRRAVTNHIGTVHAIALCNLAELTRSEERRAGKECAVRVDLGGRRSIKKKKKA